MSNVTADRKNFTISGDFESIKAILRKKVEFENWDKLNNRCTLTAGEQEREFLKQFNQAVLINSMGLNNKIH